MLVSHLFIAQNFGTIEGKVTNPSGNPISNANILMEETPIGTETRKDGSFVITNISQGTYKLNISYVGYRPLQVKVVVKANQTTNIGTLVISQSEESLSEVLLNGKSIRNNFTRNSSNYVAKLPLKRLENPQVYNTITSDLLESQVVTNFDDALKNAVGLSKLWESTGRGSDGAGYFSLRGFSVQPTLTNGVPALINGSPDPANMESIEVIKGPSGTLFGSSVISYGGLINVVTKKPYDYFGGKISYTAGSYGLNRVAVDVNTPLEEGVNLRVNAAYHDENSFQDAGFKKSFFFAPSLSYQVNDRLSFTINTEFYNGKSTNQTMLFLDRGSALRVHNMDELDYDNERSYTSNDLYTKTPTYNLQEQMNYKLSDNWTSQTILSRSNAKSDGYYSYLYEITSTVEGLTETPIEDGIILGRSTSKQNSETIGTDIQQNFIGDFNLGSIRNRLIVGLDYYKTRIISNNSGYANQGFVYLGGNTEAFQALAPALHDYYGTPIGSSAADDTGVLTQAGADAGIAAMSNPGVNYSKAEQEIFSAYASDVITIIPQLSAMASLRVDRFTNDEYNQTAFSPKFGLVYQPILDKISLFGNYMDGFSNLAPVEEIRDGVSSNKTLDPEHAKQLEVGTKINLLDGRFTATLSYYDINVKDMSLRIDIDANNYYYTQDGEQDSKGFEASIIANPIEGLNVVAGYSYNDSELVDGSNDFEGFRPESAGPKNLANLWATYKFSGNILDGFGAGFGGNYGSENKIYNRTNGTFTLDEYTVLNASLFYQTDKFGITLKLNNLNDEEYYNGWSTINPQIGRNLSANFSYYF